MNTVLIALGGCAVVIVAMLAIAIWDDIRQPATKHPFDDDIPPSWG